MSEPDNSTQSDGLYDPENEDLVNSTTTNANKAGEQLNDSNDQTQEADEQKQLDSDDEVIPLSEDDDSDNEGQEDQKMEDADSHDSNSAEQQQDKMNVDDEDKDDDDPMDTATVEKLKTLVQSDDEEPEKVEAKSAEKPEIEEAGSGEDDDDDDDVDYDPLSLLSDEKKKETSETAATTAPEDSQESTSTSHEDVDVPLFNEVIKHFFTSGMLNNPDFSNLPPKQKEKAVLEEYNKANNTNVTVRLNFSATTSYNKTGKRNNNSEQYQIMIPINPFCLRPDLTAKMSDEELAAYRAYLKQEDSSLKSGKWDNYPIGSRLFVGNLPIGSMKKADLYRIFHPYGVIAQISLKQGFGFVQYETAEHCSRAIEGEKNVPLHGKFLHLEISKHQIQKAIEQKSGKGKGGKNKDRAFKEDDIDNKKDSTEVKVVTSTDASPEFNEKLLKRLTKDGIIMEVEDSGVPAEEVPQDSITSCAYDGVMCVLVTKNDVLDAMAFESTADGGIKFDQYNDITIDEVIEIILSSKAKRFANTPKPQQRERDQYFPQNKGGKRRPNDRPRNGNQLLYGKKAGHAGRDRDRISKNQNRGRNNNYSNRFASNVNNYPVHEASYQSGNYSQRQQEQQPYSQQQYQGQGPQGYQQGSSQSQPPYGHNQQQHQYPQSQQYDQYGPPPPQDRYGGPPPPQDRYGGPPQDRYGPPPPSGQYGGPPPPRGSQDPYREQQYPPYDQQYPQRQPLPPQQQQYNHQYPPQQQYPSRGGRQTSQGSYGSPYDQNYPPQQRGPPPPQQRGGPNPNADAMKQLQNMDPGMLQSMMGLLQQQQQQQQQMPQHSPYQGGRGPNGGNGSHALNGFLNQLQTSPSGAKPPPPRQSGGNNESEDPANDLFETLARLKNNM
ncbi:unnamed protein product [Ambrosiozyma monospora]|uniref:Unnamed protein product n=1 Tax=Ambrosiozyma monospora TaxID=43982 RepID=A0A9W6YZ53_AMBMO|nr:unnamed protein product [Ambrosiozyma monospora]